MYKKLVLLFIGILLFISFSSTLATDLRVGPIFKPGLKEYLKIPMKIKFEVQNINVLNALSYTVELKIMSPLNILVFQETIPDANLLPYSNRTLTSAELFIPQTTGNYILTIKINFPSDIDTSNNTKQFTFSVAELPGIQISPARGIDFLQANVDLPAYKKPNSSIGLVATDFKTLHDSTGKTNGYLNFYNSNLGWFVQNMIYDYNSGLPGLSAMFNLNSDLDISSITAYIIFSDSAIVDTTLLSDKEYLNYLQYTVGSTTYRIGGKTDTIRVLGPPVPETIIFDPAGTTKNYWQPGHTTQEQDLNQCGPGALANSLEWLKLKKGLNITDEYKPGIKDSSLVGKIDITTGRVPHNGLSDNDMMKGKLTYLNNNNLGNKLKIKHKVIKGYYGTLSLSDTIKVEKTFSVANKDTSTKLIDWMISEIKHGEDVELGVMWKSGGGHWVDLIGGGYVKGVPWIAWVNDANQAYTDNGTTTTADDSVKNNGGLTPKEGGYGWSYINKNDEFIFIAGADSLRGKLDLAFSESIDSTATGVEESGNIFLPDNYNLEQNYPNPFNPSTKIEFYLPERSKVVLKIYDILGREVKTLLDEEMSKGKHFIAFKANNFASGIYFYRIQSGNFVETKKMILLK